MRVSIALMLLLGSTNLTAADWRQQASQQEKLENLITVMPGTSNLMIEMGERYKNLYWAAKQGKWEFAAYQREEMEALLRTLKITSPKRAASADTFLANGFALYGEAFEQKRWPRFEQAFAKMRDECMACHITNEHPFVVLPAIPPKSASPVLAE